MLHLYGEFDADEDYFHTSPDTKYTAERVDVLECCAIGLRVQVLFSHL